MNIRIANINIALNTLIDLETLLKQVQAAIRMSLLSCCRASITMFITYVMIISKLIKIHKPKQVKFQQNSDLLTSIS